jgi:HEPN domain-containing protein
LKALLVASGINPPRTHDLEALVDLLSPAPLLPDDVEDALIYLTELAVIPRYPVRSDLRSPGRADRARHELDRVIGWAQTTYGWAIPRRPSPRPPTTGTASS